MKVGTAVHGVFLHPLCCQSLTVTGAGVCFSEPSRLAFFSGAVLNCSRNTVIMGQFLALCVVCFAHTCCTTQYACIGHSHDI